MFSFPPFSWRSCQGPVGYKSQKMEWISVVKYKFRDLSTDKGYTLWTDRWNLMDFNKTLKSSYKSKFV